MTARIADSNRRHLEQDVLGGMAVGRRRLVMQSKRGKRQTQKQDNRKEMGLKGTMASPVM